MDTPRAEASRANGIQITGPMMLPSSNSPQPQMPENIQKASQPGD